MSSILDLPAPGSDVMQPRTRRSCARLARPASASIGTLFPAAACRTRHGRQYSQYLYYLLVDDQLRSRPPSRSPVTRFPTSAERPGEDHAQLRIARPLPCPPLTQSGRLANVNPDRATRFSPRASLPGIRPNAENPTSPDNHSGSTRTIFPIPYDGFCKPQIRCCASMLTSLSVTSAGTRNTILLPRFFLSNIPSLARCSRSVRAVW